MTAASSGSITRLAPEDVVYPSEELPVRVLAVRSHNTRGMGLAKVLAARACGVTVVDASAGRLGGWPHARSTSRNVATRDLVSMLDGLGTGTGVDLGRLAEAAGGTARAPAVLSLSCGGAFPGVDGHASDAADPVDPDPRPTGRNRRPRAGEHRAIEEDRGVASARVLVEGSRRSSSMVRAGWCSS